MHNNMSRCIDINTPFCPCMLAETNNCVFCGHLSGKGICDCNWTGVCILYEKNWQSHKERWRNDEEAVIRIEDETEYVITEQINDCTYRIGFYLCSELCEKLKNTGSFVFLRRPQDPDFFHFPVGIMKVCNNNVEVVIEAVGPKSKRIFEDDNRQLLVRGPYYNGIFGQPWIDNLSQGKILLVAGGVGQAPALPIAEKLSSHNNKIVALLAPGHTGKVFIEKELKDMDIDVQIVPSMRKTGMLIAAEYFAQVDLVVSAGPDDQHYGVIDAMQSAGVNIPMAATNNATMCCGEGICGSCIKQTRDNKAIRTCKVQTSFMELLRE